MTLTDDFKTADARIYCDNDDAGPDKRWQPYPDLEGAGKKSKNSKKKFEEQMWWDHTNHIFRALGARGCQELGSGTQGQTYKPKDTPDTSGLNSVREIITVSLVERYLTIVPKFSQICDVALNQKIRLLSDIDKKKDLTKQVDMVTMEDFVSLTLFHEVSPPAYFP